MAKTYLPTLLAAVYALGLYIARNRAKIRANLSGEALLAFDSLDACLTGFMAAYGDLPLGP